MWPWINQINMLLRWSLHSSHLLYLCTICTLTIYCNLMGVVGPWKNQINKILNLKYHYAYIRNKVITAYIAFVVWVLFPTLSQTILIDDVCNTFNNSSIPQQAKSSNYSIIWSFHGPKYQLSFFVIWQTYTKMISSYVH